MLPCIKHFHETLTYLLTYFLTYVFTNTHVRVYLMSQLVRAQAHAPTVRRYRKRGGSAGKPPVPKRKGAGNGADSGSSAGKKPVVPPKAAKRQGIRALFATWLNAFQIHRFPGRIRVRMCSPYVKYCNALIYSLDLFILMF